MNGSILIGLLQNTAILLALSMLYESFWINNEDKKVSVKVITGFILSGIGVVLMYTPWTMIPGIVFDTRSVMLSISGLFFGAVPTVIVMLITSLVRFEMGGDGQWMGIAVILSSGSIGLLWRYFRPDWKNKKLYYLELLAMGILVHVAMSVCTLFLPSDKIFSTFNTIVLPLILIYSPATMLLGIVMLKQYKNQQSRQAQKKLIETERRLTQVLESGNIVSLLLNKDGSISFCNDYFLKISGYSRQDIMGHKWVDYIVPGEIKEDLIRVFSNGLKSNSIANHNENQVLTKSGNPFFISWYNITLMSDSGEVTGIASIGVDITDSKAYAEMLEQKNTEIESQNKVLKHINEDLIAAKERAEESERLKLAFLANMSHEIRTPMNGILGFAGLLKKPDLTNEKQQEYIRIIENSGNRLLGIINDIVDLSKVESGMMKVHLSQSNINELVINLYKFFKLEVEAKKLELSYKISLPDLDAMISTDTEKLYAILTNLVKNAIKFTNVGNIEFGYNVKDAFLEFYVKDTGVGISPEQKELIFERFRQGSEALNRSYEGAGLGLSISKAYVEMLGGKIWVDSELNVGSVFYFTVPYDKISDQKVEENKTSKDKLMNTQIKRLKILVAEDDESMQNLIGIKVEDYCENLIIAKNGIEAVALCRKTPDLDLILMDIKMPKMNGYEATKRIREFNKDVVIIAQTAFVMNGDREKALDAGCNDYLSKPYDPILFDEIIHRHF